MTKWELNAAGERHLHEKMEPYRDLQKLFDALKECLARYQAIYKMELKNDIDLRTPYQDLVDALEDAKGNMPNLDKLAEQIAESLMEEKQFTQRDVG